MKLGKLAQALGFNQVRLADHLGAHSLPRPRAEELRRQNSAGIADLIVELIGRWISGGVNRKNQAGPQERTNSILFLFNQVSSSGSRSVLPLKFTPCFPYQFESFATFNIEQKSWCWPSAAGSNPTVPAIFEIFKYPERESPESACCWAVERAHGFSPGSKSAQLTTP